MVGDTLSASAFLVLGGAFVIEGARAVQAPPTLSSTAVVAIGVGIFAATDQQQFVASLPGVAAAAAGAAVLATLYRTRGFLAAWIAGMAFGWLNSSMALRSLDDPSS